MNSILLIIIGGGIGAIVALVILVVICKKLLNRKSTKDAYKWSIVDMTESSQQDDDFEDEENIRTIERSEMVQSHSDDEDSDSEDYYSARGDGSALLLRSNTICSQDYHSIRSNKWTFPRSNTR